MSDQPPPSEEPVADEQVAAEAAETPEAGKPAPRPISEVPILTFQARLGSRLQVVLGILLVLTWFGGDTSRAWPWDPVRHGDIGGWSRGILPIAGLLLLASRSATSPVRMLLLALTASVGLWHGTGVSWDPVPNWFLGGRWAEAAPLWCFLLTPAFAILAGGILGAGSGEWSRLRVFALAACALTIFLFYWWPLSDQILPGMFVDEIRVALRNSVVLGTSLAVLWAAALMLTLASIPATLSGEFDVRVHSLCVRVLMAFVIALIVSRLSAAGEMRSVSLVRSFVFMLNALAITLREIALAASLGLAAALWLEHHEGRRARGWARAF